MKQNGNMKKIILPILLAGSLPLAANRVTAWTADRPYAAAANNDTLFAEAPQWMAELCSPSVNGQNYREIVQRFEAYRRTLPNGGKKTPFNKHVLNYFKRWQTMIEPFVFADGTIRLPDADAYQKQINRMNSLAEAKAKTRKARGMDNEAETPAAPQADWHVVAPFNTFDYKSKKAAPWQSNIQRFDVAKTNENILYCGSETGMVFKTVDKGKNWKPCAPMHYFGGEVSTVEVSETSADKVLVGAGMSLWLTEDGGDTWKNITPRGAGSFKRVRDAVFDPKNDNRILMGSDEGVFLSEDGGNTWTRKLSGRCFDIKFQRGEQASGVYLLLDQIYDRKGACMYVSTDNGKEFSRIQIPDTRFSSGRIAVTPANKDYVYLLACQGSNAQHPFFHGEPCLMKSTDGGKNWTKNEISGQMNVMDSNGGQGYYDMVIAASPKDAEHLLFGILFLYSSHDGGKTLDQHPQNTTSDPSRLGPEIGGYFGKYELHTDMQDLYISEATAETWLSTDGGMAYCANIMDSEPVISNNGIYAVEFWGFDQGWNEDVIVGGRNHNGNMVYLADYDSVSVALQGSEVPTGYVFLSNPRKIAFSDTNQKLLVPDKWTDEFRDFEGAERFWVFPMESTRYGVGFEYHPAYAQNFLIATHSRMATGDEGLHILWRTTDDGLSYTKVFEFEGDISSYAVSRANPEKIVVAAGTRIYHSEDGGKTFEAFDTPDEMQNTLSFKVALHPTREDEIWVSTHAPGGMYRTTDNGASWQKMDQGLDLTAPNGNRVSHEITRFFLTGNEKNAVYAIADAALQYTESTLVYAGRVVYWDEAQQCWTDFSQGLPEMIRLNRMLPFYKEGKIRVATNNGVWETALADTVFAPIAQPLLLNDGDGADLKTDELHFDSYSIVNQKNAQWQWQFQPQPLSVSDATARNPVVRIQPDQSYHVTLTVTNAEGQTDSRTVKNMIRGSKDVPTTGISETTAETGADKTSVTLLYTLLQAGTPLHFRVHHPQGELTIRIYNAKGQMIHQEALRHGDNTLSLPGLTPGMHFYRVEGDSYLSVGRFYVR